MRTDWAKGDIVTAADMNELARLTRGVRFDMADATEGMTKPARAQTGQPITWAGEGINTGRPTGRSAFWAAPGGTAAYASIDLGADVRHLRGRFTLGGGSGGLGGTACIAAASAPLTIPAPVGLQMKWHLWFTRTTWAITVWDGGQQIVGAPGAFDGTLPALEECSIEAWHLDPVDDKPAGVLVRTPDGDYHERRDARFGTLGGSHVFIESFTPGATDDVVLAHGLTAGI